MRGSSRSLPETVVETPKPTISDRLQENAQKERAWAALFMAYTVATGVIAVYGAIKGNPDLVIPCVLGGVSVGIYATTESILEANKLGREVTALLGAEALFLAQSAQGQSPAPPINVPQPK